MPTAPAPAKPLAPTGESHVTNFIRNIIEHDLDTGAFAGRTWAGKPGPAAAQAGAPKDPARIRTRFPPEPNGYLHYRPRQVDLPELRHRARVRRHAATCASTTPIPTKEEHRIRRRRSRTPCAGSASTGARTCTMRPTISTVYDFAEELIEHGHAYVDEPVADEMRAYRGTLTERRQEFAVPRPPRRGEPRPVPRACARASIADGAHVLRAKIDMASPNINLRDPAIYRIRHATHHRTGDTWCIYPMYDLRARLSDAIEGITHSLCTLEFEDHRPLYDWLQSSALAEVRPARSGRCRSRSSSRASTSPTSCCASAS